MPALRPYQKKSRDALYAHLREKDTNPCVVIPTAGGKSVCIAEVVKDAVLKWHGRVLVLAHVKELVDQNSKEIAGLCPELEVGVYSAGLDRRDTAQNVIVAGIQSIYRQHDLFKPFDLIMVDEVHMVPPDGDGRYRTFLEEAKRRNPNVRLVGWTATPFRTHGGLICKPENLFQEICYEVGVKELIDGEYISKITAHAGTVCPDLSGLHIRAGEFVAEDVEKAMGEDRLVSSACREIVEKTRNRKACLVFCTSVAHCRKVAECITRFSGEECAIVTGETPAEEREEIIARMKGESVRKDLFGTVAPPLKYCCNVSVLTTGTNIRRLDTIAILRPTASAGLFVQMVGRGFRLSPETGKTECLILDYGKNVERFGPIDCITSNMLSKPDATGSHGSSGPLAKVCPGCNNLVALGVMLCPECGHEFPRTETRHEARAANTAILSGEISLETYTVLRTDFEVWHKREAPPDAPRTVRVTYHCAPSDTPCDPTAPVPLLTPCRFSEWVCPEHVGYARNKFEKWWRERAIDDMPPPFNAEEVCESDYSGVLRRAEKITVRRISGNRYPEVVGYELADAPLDTAHDQLDPDDLYDLPF